MSWFERICSYETCQNYIAKTVQIAVTIGLLYVFWVLIAWLWMWWEPDLILLNDYLDVKLPSVIVGSMSLMMATWVYDILTPGDFQRQIASDPKASAIFMGAYVLGLALILAK